ncbi:hypothetical protein L6164_016717 [Bauhinia variegata]|uniref:Uncharacterized protein n=1 Tax=Bauhinia variegata TaxID=167791 RepID=A0ACB9NAP7_BAUVA|nr:hypothetical protein L6164_016717 [Bauhinia variegata]
MASLSEAPHMESFMSFPPGFKFYPTDQELIYFYLRKKINKEKLPTNPIREVNIYLYNPIDLAAMYRDYEGHDGWYFLTPRDQKYPNEKRPNRSANNGYWKATGADKEVCHGDQIIGYKRTLVFYHGKPPKGTKTDWIMHEYTLKEPIRTRTSPNDMKLDEWVLCKIYERRKRLEDAEDNDQTQLSTLSQYLLHPLHQLLPQVPSEVSQKLQQTPPPPSQPPQLVTSLHTDAHEVNTYSFGQLSPWNNPQPILLSPLPLSQP